GGEDYPARGPAPRRGRAALRAAPGDRRRTGGEAAGAEVVAGPFAPAPPPQAGRAAPGPDAAAATGDRSGVPGEACGVVGWASPAPTASQAARQRHGSRAHRARAGRAGPHYRAVTKPLRPALSK